MTNEAPAILVKLFNDKELRKMGYRYWRRQTDTKKCRTNGCNRDPYDSSGYCGTCLNYMDGTY